MCIGTNRMNLVKLESIISAALDAGFFFFDSARDYMNEHLVGEALHKSLTEREISRKDIFITTKVGNG